MRVFLPTLGQDTGGQGIRIKQAFDRLDPSTRVRSMATKQVYIKYPRDMEPDMVAMQAEYDAADVIHQRNNMSGYAHLDHDQGKPTVVHHQGTAYRTRSHYLNQVCQGIGALQCVSTIDLELIHGHPWLPSPFNLPEMAAIGEAARLAGRSRRADKIVVTHAPTNRAIKSTSIIMRAVRRLADFGFPVELDLIEGRPWEECLARKARSDIYIDQLILGYGNNAVEAWTMGVPVVAGAQDPLILKRMREIIGYLPFWEATEQNLVERLRAMLTSSTAREDAAGAGLEYAREFHDGRRTVEILRGLWSSAGPTAGSSVLKVVEHAALHPKRTGKMVIFKTSKYPALMVRLGDRRFKFAGGKLRVDEADAPAIEEFAAKRPEYGIVWEHVTPVSAPPETAAPGPIVRPAPAPLVAEPDTAPAWLSDREAPTGLAAYRAVKAELQSLGLSTSGSKIELEERLAAHKVAQFAPDHVVHESDE